MPRGVSLYDEARLQGRLWAPRVRPATSLLRWWDAPDLSQIQATAAGVSQLSDKSGNSGHAVQATDARKPTLALNALNGLAGLRFGASAFNALVYPQIGGQTAVTMFYVMRRFAETPSEVNAGPLFAGTSIQGNYEHEPYSDHTIYVGYYSTERKTVGNPGTPFFINPHVFEVRSAPNDWRYSADGRQLFQTTSNTFNSAASPRITSPQIGGYDTSYYFNGWFFEAVIEAGTPSDQLRSLYRGYFAAKYGLQGGLPSSDQFRNRPPLIGD